MKKVLLGLVAIIVLFVIVSLFLSREVKTEHSIVVKGSLENTFAQVNNLKNWPKWSAWDQIDPNIVHTYEDTVGTGAHRKWESQHQSVGNGSMTITESKENEMVAIDLQFMENGSAKSEYWFEETDEGVKITTKFESEMPWVIGPWIKMMMMPELEKNTLKSLEQIKAIVENMPEPKPMVQVSEVETSELWFVGIKDTITMEEMDSVHQKLYGELMVIEGITEKMAGQPIAIWHAWKPESNMAVIEAAIPVSDTTFNAIGRAHIGNIPAGKAVMASHWGWYDSLGKTHEGINAYLEKKGLTDNGPRWEVYVTDPTKESDTSKIETRVYVPV